MLYATILNFFFLFIFFFIPIGLGFLFTLSSSFGHSFIYNCSHCWLDFYHSLFNDPQIYTALSYTFRTGLISCFLSIVLTFLISGGLFQILSWKKVERYLPLLLSFPHITFAIGVVFLISPSGIFIRLLAPLLEITLPPTWQTYRDPFGLSLIIVLTFKETIFLLFMVFSKLSQININQQLWLSRSFGYTASATWAKIIWPQIYLGIRLPFFIVMSYSFSPIDMSIILSPNTPPPLVILALNWFNDNQLENSLKGSAAAIVLLVTFIMGVGTWMLLEKIFFISICKSIWRGVRDSFSFLNPWIAKVIFYSILLTSLLSFFINLIWSFTKSWPFPDLLPNFTLETWYLLFDVRFFDFFKNTMLLAILSSFIGLATSILLIESDLWIQRKPKYFFLNLLKFPLARAVFFIPLLIPPISFLIGIRLLFLYIDYSQHEFIFILIGHFLFVFPYIFLTLEKVYRSYDQNYFLLGQTLAQGTWKVFLKIKWPMLWKPILFSLVIGFSISFMEYLSTVILSAGKINTITTEAIQLSSGGNRRVMGFFMVIQTILMSLVFLTTLLGKKSSSDRNLFIR